MAEKPRFSDTFTDSDWGPAMICPSCGEFNLHLNNVEVFDRDSEDALEGVHTTTGHGTVSVERSMTANPSPRRDAIVLHFWCEHCPEVQVLRIIQHKGTEFMGWQK